MINNLKFSLEKYSGMAGVFLLIANDSQSQAVYTNIEPDIEIQFDGQTAGVDIDNNGAFDFGFLKSSDTNEWGIGQYRLRKTIWAGPQFITNEIAGDFFTYSAGGGTTYLPCALNSGNLINEDLSFQYWGYQLMGVAVANTNTPSDWAFHGGHWVATEDPLFLGVRFIGEDECLHYGWIRCSVIDTVNVLVIHDFAYESKCETSIKAGDKIGDTSVSVIEATQTLDADVYSFGQRVYINLNELVGESEIFIFDLQGKLILSRFMTDSFFSFELLQPSGQYIVKIVSENKIYSTEIFLF